MASPRPGGERTLAQQYVLLAGALVVVTATAVAALVLAAQARVSRAELRGHGNHVAAILARAAGSALRTSDEAALRSVVSSVRVDQTVSYVAVLAPDGRVLASEARHAGVRLPRHEPSWLPRAGGEVRSSEAGEEVAGEEAVDFVVAVTGGGGSAVGAPPRPPELLGYVQVGVGTAVLRERLLGFAGAVGGLTLVLAALGVGAATFLARRTVGPLERLRAVIRDVEGGRLDVPVEASGTAEIRELARGFDAMLSRLRQSREEAERRAAELQASNADLAREVAERGAAEHRLRRQAMIVANLHEAVALLDAEGRVVDWNPAAAALLGHGAERRVAGPVSELFRPEAREGLAQALAEARGEGRWEGVLEAQHEDGEAVPCEVAVIALPAELAEANLVLVFRDLSERAQLEAQLRQAQKMEAVGRLAGGVAHDFNNLLTVISGYCDLLLGRQGLEETVRGPVSTIRDAARRATSVTSQLLAFSRRQVMVYRVLDLSEVVSRVDDLLRRILGEHVQVVTRRAPRLWPVRADPTQLEQVMMNLAVNARDAMPRGGTLSLELSNVELDAAFVERHPGAKPGPHVCLAVSDTGTGMAPEALAHLFEPFFTTKEAGKGTGLGLATVYGIVKQSGGYVAVESEADRGTTFRVYLPRHGDGAEPEADRERGPEALPGGTEVVLVVEDDDIVRRLAVTMLAGRGFEVLEARNAGEALLIAERRVGPLHLLLTDVVMPHMGGGELARRMATLRPDTRVLFFSGYTDDEGLLEGIRDVDVAFLPKPFTSEALARKVREVLDSKHPA